MHVHGLRSLFVTFLQLFVLDRIPALQLGLRHWTAMGFDYKSQEFMNFWELVTLCGVTYVLSHNSANVY